jgi:hypothetical protein
MQPIQTLPGNYTLGWDVDMKRDKRLNIILQIIGLGWMGLAAWPLATLMLWIRPDFSDAIKLSLSENLLISLLLVLVVMLVTIVLHELVHGLFFWIFTHHQPEFGVGPGYAFAAMPDWFFRKGQYLVIGLGPLIVLTVLGIAWCAFAPVTWLGLIFAGVVINAGGAIGDLYVCWRIAREAEDAWVKDTGDGFQVYRRRVV